MSYNVQWPQISHLFSGSVAQWSWQPLFASWVWGDWIAEAGGRRLTRCPGLKAWSWCPGSVHRFYLQTSWKQTGEMSALPSCLCSARLQSRSSPLSHCHHCCHTRLKTCWLTLLQSINRQELVDMEDHFPLRWIKKPWGSRWFYVEDSSYVSLS